MKLTSFYRKGELSSIRVSSVDEVVDEVKNLLFEEQLKEEQIFLEIYSSSTNKISQVDELRLDFDRIYSKKQINKKCSFGRWKFIDSAKFEKDFSIKTILNIKNEESYLNAKFHDYQILTPGQTIFRKSHEPLLFARLKNNNFYLLSEISEKNRKPLVTRFKQIKSWIQKRISSKTSSK